MSSCIIPNLQTAYIKLGELCKDFDDEKIFIMHAKVIDAFNSVAETFFSVQIPWADNFKGALKTLKGWNAIDGLPNQVLDTCKSIDIFVKKMVFPRFLDCVEKSMKVASKLYEAASFAERELGLVNFQGVTESYKRTYFSSSLVGSVASFLGAIGRAFYSDGILQGSDSFKVVESISSAVFAGGVLIGASNQLTTGASAISAFVKGAEYFWKKSF